MICIYGICFRGLLCLPFTKCASVQMSTHISQRDSKFISTVPFIDDTISCVFFIHKSLYNFFVPIIMDKYTIFYKCYSLNSIFVWLLNIS